jgi:PQ loop repeat
MSTPASLPKCGEAPHNSLAFTLSACISVGLVASYLPQHYRIISSRSSEGFSPWFLLLGMLRSPLFLRRYYTSFSFDRDRRVPKIGATSSASSLLNVIALQWRVVRCCGEWVGTRLFLFVSKGWPLTR